MQETGCNAGDPNLILGLERSLGEGIGNSLQISFLGNPMETGELAALIPAGMKAQNKPAERFPLPGDEQGPCTHCVCVPPLGLRYTHPSGLIQERQMVFT